MWKMEIFVLQVIHSHTKILTHRLCLSIVDKQKVWLVGSSILKHAQLEAFLRPGGLHLNLKRLNISLWWQGYSGLKLSQVEQKLKTLAKVGPAPNVILIH